MPRDRRRSQCRHAGLGRHAASRQARARSGVTRSIAREHRQAGGRLHPHGDAHRQGDGEIPEPGRLSVPAGPAGGDPRASGLAFYGARKGRSIAPLPAPAGRAETLAGAALRGGAGAAWTDAAEERARHSPEEAAAAAARIGFPVALKIVSRAISHKTEAGGVRLQSRIGGRGRARGADAGRVRRQGRAGRARSTAILVQEMVDGVEMIVGARTDPLYGPMLVVGAGGILVELVKDVAFRLLPVTPEDARAMIGELKVAKLLAGFRGKPAADVDALVAAICGLSDFYLDHRHLLSDLEINPLIVLPKGNGVRAVDVRLVSRALRTEDGDLFRFDPRDKRGLRDSEKRHGPHLLRAVAAGHSPSCCRLLACAAMRRTWRRSTRAADQHVHRQRGGRRLRRLCAAGRPPHRPLHPGQSVDRADEDAGRERQRRDPAHVHLPKEATAFAAIQPGAITKPIYDVQRADQVRLHPARLSRQRQHRGQSVLGPHRRQGARRSRISSPTS